MKNNYRIFIILVVTILYNVNVIFRYQEPALSFIFKGAYAGIDYMGEMIWFFLFISVSFYFVGNIEDRFYGFGIYEMVRGAKRSIILLKCYAVAGLQLLFITIGQIAITIILSKIVKVDIFKEDFSTFILYFAMYFFTVYTLILIQLFLELYVKPQIAMLALNIYVVFSISLAGVLYKYKELNSVLYGLIPNFAMSLRTSVINKDIFAINYKIAAVFLGFILLCIVISSIKRIQRKDIY
ncbi:MAG: DUF2705 family protein [Eubacteriaceae bacterium]